MLRFPFQTTRGVAPAAAGLYPIASARWAFSLSASRSALALLRARLRHRHRLHGLRFRPGCGAASHKCAGNDEAQLRNNGSHAEVARRRERNDGASSTGSTLPVGKHPSAPVRATTQGCVTDDEVCLLDPIHNDGSGDYDQPPPCTHLNPYCNGGGGGDGGDDGGDDGSGGMGPGSGDPTPPPAEHEDNIANDTIPDCNQAQVKLFARAYCSGTVPEGERLRKTLVALDKVAARGGVCVSIAEHGRYLISSRQFRYYPSSTEYGNVGGWGSPTIGAILDEAWVDAFGEADPNFHRKVVHEIDHAMGLLHHADVNGSPYSVNEVECSGL